MSTETITIPHSFYDPKTRSKIFGEIEVTGETFKAQVGGTERKFIIYKCNLNGWILTDTKTGAVIGRQCKHKKMTVTHANVLISWRPNLTEMLKNAETTGALTVYH